jgi:uncharacterized protein YcbX
MNKLTVSGIWIYPIKSLGSIALQSARVLPKGLEYDRRWMLVDSENQFMTQRDFPRMALFKPGFERGNIEIRYESHNIGLPVHYMSDPITARIWKDTVEVYEVSQEHSDWFSSMLGFSCRLVAFPENNLRPVDPIYAINQNNVSLADGYPLLIIGQSSLDDLNGRLEQPLPMNRFRPNIVFEGGEPYEEDQWKNFQIGRNRFAGVKPCARCPIPTINQDTAETGKEPLATLATYRRQGNNIYFGQNLLPLDHYEIAIGDEIILE